MRSLVYPALLLLSSAPGGAGAECACLCVDGALQTLCASALERRTTVDLCRTGPVPVCPPAEPEQRSDLRRYPGAVEGASNCRDAQVFDPGQGMHVVARVCDVAPDG